nr:hypothetical protein [Tanacetum cinerariifolium]
MIYKIQKCDLEDAIEMRSNILGGRWKLGLIILDEEERKLEIVVDGLAGGGLVFVVERSSNVSKIAWGEVEGVENKILMGLMLIAKGEECLDGWVGASRGEVKRGGVDLRVTKSFLGETFGESGGEEFGVDGGVI